MKRLKSKIRMRKRPAFTLVELITAIGVMVMVIAFSSVIFRASIEGYRTASANSEIIHNLQTITTQLDRDFQNLPKDGYLKILSRKLSDKRQESKNSNEGKAVEMDGMYYFTEGDFQSWFDSNLRSNIARVYFGHDYSSLNNSTVFLSKCKLVRGTMLLTPENRAADSNMLSFSEMRAFSDPFANYPIPDESVIDSNSIRSLMCEGVGEMKIVFIDKDDTDSDGEPILFYKEDGSLNWMPGAANDHRTWQRGALPDAIKFKFTLYDSKGILRGGREFTHIVYLGN